MVGSPTTKGPHSHHDTTMPKATKKNLPKAKTPEELKIIEENKRKIAEINDKIRKEKHDMKVQRDIEATRQKQLEKEQTRKELIQKRREVIDEEKWSLDKLEKVERGDHRIVSVHLFLTYFIKDEKAEHAEEMKEKAHVALRTKITNMGKMCMCLEYTPTNNKPHFHVLMTAKPGKKFDYTNYKSLSIPDCHLPDVKFPGIYVAKCVDYIFKSDRSPICDGYTIVDGASCGKEMSFQQSFHMAKDVKERGGTRNDFINGLPEVKLNNANSVKLIADMVGLPDEIITASTVYEQYETVDGFDVKGNLDDFDIPCIMQVSMDINMGLKENERKDTTIVIGPSKGMKSTIASIFGRRLWFYKSITDSDYLPNVDNKDSKFIVFDDCDKEYTIPLSGVLAPQNIRYIDQAVLTCTGKFNIRKDTNKNPVACTNRLPTLWIQNSNITKHRFWEDDVQYWSQNAVVIEITNMKAKEFLKLEKEIYDNVERFKNPSNPDYYNKQLKKGLRELYILDGEHKDYIGKGSLSRKLRGEFQGGEPDDIEEHIIIRNIPALSAKVRYSKHPLWKRYLPDEKRFMTTKEWEAHLKKEAESQSCEN